MPLNSEMQKLGIHFWKFATENDRLSWGTGRKFSHKSNFHLTAEGSFSFSTTRRNSRRGRTQKRERDSDSLKRVSLRNHITICFIIWRGGGRIIPKTDLRSKGTVHCSLSLSPFGLLWQNSGIMKGEPVRLFHYLSRAHSMEYPCHYEKDFLETDKMDRIMQLDLHWSMDDRAYTWRSNWTVTSPRAVCLGAKLPGRYQALSLSELSAVHSFRCPRLEWESVGTIGPSADLLSRLALARKLSHSLSLSLCPASNSLGSACSAKKSGKG